jgi:hypothetical protein
VVEGARLEREYSGNRIKGSNPFLSAKIPCPQGMVFLRPAPFSRNMGKQQPNNLQTTLRTPHNVVSVKMELWRTTNSPKECTLRI